MTETSTEPEPDRAELVEEQIRISAELAELEHGIADATAKQKHAQAELDALLRHQDILTTKLRSCTNALFALEYPTYVAPSLQRQSAGMGTKSRKGKSGGR